MDTKRLAAWPRAWRWLACMALAAWLAMPAPVQASPGCQALNGASGSLAPYGYLGLLDNSQPVNQGDRVSLTVSAGQMTYVGSFLTISNSGGTVSGVESGSGASADGLNNIGSTTAVYSITCTSVAPAATVLSPTSGSAGAAVVITGSGLWGTTAVSFGGVPASSFSLGNGANGNAKITAIAPAATGAVTVQVTTDGGTSSAGTFTFTAAPPTAGPVSATVPFNSSNNPIALNVTGAFTSVAVVNAPLRGVATVQGKTITYTPSTNYFGSDNFTYTVTNASGTSSPGTVTITVSQGTQTILFSNPGSQNFGTSPQLNATSSSGLQINFSSTTPNICTVSSTGLLTTVSPGTCTINANQAGDSQWLPASQVSQSFQIVVPGGAISFATPSLLPAATAGTQYTQNIAVIGGFQPYTFAVNSGALPNGMSLDPNSGTLSGTPLASGTFTFIVRVTDQATQSAQMTYQLTVNAPTITLIPATLPQGKVGVPSSTIVTASGGSAPYSYAITAGALPVGLTLSQAGVLSGSPTVAGSFNVTITATDRSHFQGAQSYTMVVGQATPVVLNSTASTSANTPVTIPVVSGAGPITSIAVTTQPAHGAATVNGLTIVYTPSNYYFGSDTLSYTATGPGGTSAPATVSITVVAGAVPTVTAQSTALVAGQSVTIHGASGAANGPFTSATVVNAPAVGTVTVQGTDFIYTVPANASGTAGFDYTVSNAYGASQPAHVTITINALPVAVAQSAAVIAGRSVTINATTGASNGPFTAAAVSTPPGSGTAVVQGTNIVYTAAADASGTIGFDYTVSNAYGVSQPAHVTVTINQLPVAAAQSATVLAGQSVTIHTAAGATNGPIVSAAVVTPPTSGTAVVQGTDVVFTAPADASGEFGFDFTVSNAYGLSKPAHVTLTINPAPSAANLNATVIAGKSVQVDLTTAAHGGPFTGAKLVSISPSNAGSASIQAGAKGYTLSFTAAATFSGSAQLNYTLSNAFAESAPGIITVAVTPRSDPSKDAEVLGVLDAQADAARRMATGQIDNFQRRLETLHSSGSAAGFDNGITLSSASSQRQPQTFSELGQQSGMNRYRVAPDADETQTPAPASTLQGGSLPGGVSVWTGGAVNFGKMQTGTSDNGIDFTTAGLSMGVDKAFSSSFAAGFGVGYGHDVSDVGQHGSRSSLDSYNVAFYGSYHPAGSFYVDGLLGYQWLNFDARRYVTDDGNMVHGSRDGTQEFGSLSLGYEHQAADMQLTPYGRLDIARAHLDGYTESGDSTYALAYQRQTVKTATGTLGLLAQWTVKEDYGVWSPQLRAEFGHDMQGSDAATMRYADLLTGPLYQATLTGQSRNHSLLGAGVSLQTLHGWLLRMEYQAYLDNSSSNNQSILLGVEKKFQP